MSFHAKLAIPQRLLRRAAYVVRMIEFLLFHGRARGVVALGRGIVYAPGMSVILGSRVWIGSYAVFQGEGQITVGDSTYIGSHASLNCIERISIGRHCMLANFVSIVDNNHGSASTESFARQAMTSAPVTIGDDCWIGEKASLLEGVSVGDGSIVAAGAVVVEDVAARTVVGGVPARILRSL
jgi:acetyltransferase-like isoleucine patch superfamily enzyme